MAAGKKKQSTSSATSSKSAPAKRKQAVTPVEPAMEIAPAVDRPHAAAGIPVVGLCASAGGLNAFKKFFSELPANSGMAFVLIPHLDPTHQSLMVELLTKYANVAISEASEGEAVIADHAYVIPPNKYMSIRGGKLHLTGPVERGGIQTSIDLFLRSLAEDQHERAICIILSGTGAHGTLGLQAVKANGGMAMVQDPATAEFDRMPQNAIATGLADFVLPPEQMPAALIQYVQHFDVNRTVVDTSAEGLANDLMLMLALLRVKTKYDFRCYRNKMLIRRIERRMGLNHIERMSDYLAVLREQPEEVKRLTRDLLISVTSFFRDPEAYHILETQVVSQLLQAKEGDAPLRLWIAGCATGEEAYSLAIIFLEQMAMLEKNCRLQLFATDVDENALEIARRGVYPESITVDVSPERLRRYFTRSNEGAFRVNKQLREVVTFASQNLISDAPFSRLDLISCRNLLIYLEPGVQRKVISLLHFALNEGGFLLLGSSETIGPQIDLFEPVSKKWRVYRRLGPSRPDRVNFPIASSGESRGGELRHGVPAGERVKGFAELTHGLLLADYAPTAVLINRKHEVLYFHGPTGRYLDQPTGTPTQDLMLLAREGLRSKLRSAVHSAIGNLQRVVVSGVRIKCHEVYRRVRITVKPVEAPKSVEGLLLVTFEDEADQVPAETGDDAHEKRLSVEDEALVGQLENELASTREDLQSTIEELETSNEQLKASNEEVMSMNEELQSANEELETSKEELQSLNEELSTVNNQLHEKVEELELANNDLANLLASTEIGTVFLDLKLNIKRFTPATSKLLNLRPSDEGRPLTDLALKFTDEALVADCEEVLRNLAPKEREVQTTDQHWCLRRIVPYRTTGNKIDGIVITFTDVTQLKQAAARAQRLATVLIDSNDAILVFDFDGRITEWNRGAELIYGYSEAEALNLNVAQLIPEARRADELAQLERLRKGSVVHSRETQRACQDGRVVEVWLTVTVLKDQAGRPCAIATTERDITEQRNAQQRAELRIHERTADLNAANQKLMAEIAERKRAEDALRESTDRLRAIIDTAAEGVITITDQGIIDTYNAAAERMFGYSANEVIGQNVTLLMPVPYREAHGGYWVNDKRTGGARILGLSREVLGRRKDGSTFPLELAVSELHHGTGSLFTGLIRDVTDRKTLEKEVLEIAAHEQLRIGQDLHDSVGQNLTGLGFTAQNLAEGLAKGDPTRARLATKLADGLRKMLHEVRMLARGLIPVEVDARGLMTALEDLASGVSADAGVTCHFTCHPPVHLSDNLAATQLFRIAQEAVTNALKHGHPKRIDMRLQLNDNQVVLTVADDGTGIQDPLPESRGIGLKIMRYRAGLINATLTITPAEQGGTVVTCRLQDGVAS